jgi:esterase/lipase superfamily enzyme
MWRHPSHLLILWVKLNGRTRSLNPREDFAAVQFDAFERPENLYNELGDAPEDTVYLFIHGYSNTTSEALYRYAQIAVDFDLSGRRAMFP